MNDPMSRLLARGLTSDKPIRELSDREDKETCKAGDPLDAVDDLLEVDDFDGALAALQQLRREGRLRKYRPKPTGGVLDIRELQRAGEVKPRQSKFGSISLTWTRDAVVGWRAWFKCPDCDRRCAILFDRCCRHCRGIRYASQYQSKIERLRAKATELREQLHAPDELFAFIPGRPYGMRRARYGDLLTDLEEIEIEAARRLGSESGFIARLHDRFRVARESSALLDRRKGLG